jgi:hypothetical protein
VLVQDGGYWVKIEARQMPSSHEVPHGIRYSLTLHDPSGARVLGFDNAHAPPKAKGRMAGRRREHDHWHRAEGRTRGYEFVDAARLLSDFFAAVDRALKDRGIV